MSNNVFMKRLIAIVFGVFLISSVTVGGYGYFDTLEESSSGTLTIGDWGSTCTTISTPQEFFDYATSSSLIDTDFYCLINDIDFTGFTWEHTDAYDSNRLRGLFDGNGYTLSNLKMTTNATTNQLFSIFAVMEGATIQNVNIDNFGPDLTVAQFNNAQLESAIFASEVWGLDNTIENVTITNSNVIANAVDGAGGLVTTVKANADLTIKNIKVRNTTILNDERRAGGLISRVLAGTGVIVVEDIDFIGNIGSLRSATNSTSHTGSISGTIQAVDFTASRVIAEYTSIATIDLNDGQISVTTGKNVGGFVGNNNTGSIMTINHSFFTGNLYTERSGIGSVLGRKRAEVTLNEVYYSNVYFSDSYTVTTGSGVINATMVHEQAMPDSTWWDSFKVHYDSANDLWTQDATGRLELNRD